MYFFIILNMLREKESIDIKNSISWLYKNHICRSKCLTVSLQAPIQIKQLDTEHPVDPVSKYRKDFHDKFFSEAFIFKIIF